MIIPRDHLLLEAIEKAKEAQDIDRFRFLMRHAVILGKTRGYADDVSFDIAKRPLAFGWYVAMRLNGATHRLAEMLALGESPFLMTDAVFLAGLPGLNKSFEKNEAMGAYYKDEAAKFGVDITGATYLPGLADFPGDPRAWVRGRGDILAQAEERNLTVTGAVNRKAREDTPPPPDIDVADDLVADKVWRRLQENPDLADKGKDGSLVVPVNGELWHETKQSMLPSKVA